MFTSGCDDEDVMLGVIETSTHHELSQKDAKAIKILNVFGGFPAWFVNQYIYPS